MRTVLTMPRGRLRPATTEDLDTLLGLLHEEEVRRYLCDNTMLPRETVAAMLTQSTQLDARGLGLWMIEQPSGDCLGVAGLQPVPVEMSAVPTIAGFIEPIIALRPEYWGHGLAGEAMATLRDYARGSLRLAQLVAAVDEPNTRSHRMMQHCGFTPVGTTPGPANELILYRLQLSQAPCALD